MTVQQRRHYTQLLLRSASKNLVHLQQYGITGTRSSIGRLSSSSPGRCLLGVRSVSSSCHHSLESMGVYRESTKGNNGKKYPSSSWWPSRRWQHSTPAAAPSSTSGSNSPNTNTKGAASLHEQGDNFPSGILTVEEGNRVLTLAAEEARCLLFTLKELQADSSSSTSSSSPSGSSYLVLDGDRFQAEAEGAVKAAKALMTVTQSKNDLAAVIIRKRTDHENADVAPLHRAFLTVTQWCLNLATTTQNGGTRKSPSAGSSDGGGLLLADNEMLDHALSLSMRANELSLPFHLPLYQRLGSTVAQQMSVDPLAWIFRLSHWAEAEMGPIDGTFFSQPLLALCQRHRLVDASNLIKGMELEHDIDNIDPEITKEILFLVKDLIRPIWSENENHSPSRLEQDAVELVLLLESSIWRIFDYPPLLDEEDALDDSHLREAFEAIVSTEEDTRQAYSSLVDQMLSETEVGLLDDSDDEDYDDDDDNDDEDDELDHLPPVATGDSQPRGGNAWKSPGQSTLTGGKVLPTSDFDIASGEETILNVSPHGVLPASSSDDDDDKEEEIALHIKMLYTRQQGYRDIPDLASQLQEMNGGAELRYSKEFERQIFHQIFPPRILDDEDNDTDLGKR